MVSTELPGALGMMNLTGFCGQFPADRNGKVAACEVAKLNRPKPAAMSVLLDKFIVGLREVGFAMGQLSWGMKKTRRCACFK
jgi:hypothetical protein